LCDGDFVIDKVAQSTSFLIPTLQGVESLGEFHDALHAVKKFQGDVSSHTSQPILVELTGKELAKLLGVVSDSSFVRVLFIQRQDSPCINACSVSLLDAAFATAARLNRSTKLRPDHRANSRKPINGAGRRATALAHRNP
jgi:hypothetical protein